MDETNNMMMSRMIYQAGIHWRHEVKRYDYHHGPFSTIDRNNSDDDYFQVTLMMDSESVVSYLLPTEIYNARHFPFRELAYTFAEQVGVHVQQLEFRHQDGTLLPMLIATPDSLGMLANQDFVIVVSIVTSNHDKRTRIFKLLNCMGRVTIGMAPHQGGDAFGSDLLPRILEFAGIDFLVTACQVCRHWFHVSQRYSVLVQLQDGYADTWQTGQQYPSLLHDKCRPTFHYYLAQCQGEMGLSSSFSVRAIRIGSKMIQKERTQSHAFGYCKGAGCRGYKTVYMETISSEMDTKWQALHKARIAFVEHTARHTKYEVVRKADVQQQRQTTTFPKDDRLMISNKGKGLCPHCGVQTHSTSIFRTVALTNDSVYQGICIQCHPTMIPTKFLLDLGILIPKIRAIATTMEQQQDFPPKKGEASNGFIAEANDWRYKACAVELYRRFFGSDVHPIVSLIVNKETAPGGAGGMDFRTCTTSLIFGTLPAGRRRSLTSQEKILERMLCRNAKLSTRQQGNRLPSWLTRPCCEGSEGPPPPPLGAVSWRIHDAEDISAKAMGLDEERRQQRQRQSKNKQRIPMKMQNYTNNNNAARTTMINGSKPQIILEVLFLAVWDPFRGGDYGSALVTALESKLAAYAKAMGHKSALMYVEIGFEQPLAKKFWVENGFAPIVAADHQLCCKANQCRPVEDDVMTGRIVELEDWQLGFIDRRCLRFKDTEQYAKRVLVD